MDGALFQSLPTNFWNVDIADVISILLTLALVGVYLSMRNIQDEQNTIQRTQNELMQRQTALMAANHLPKIEIDRTFSKGDSIFVELANRGSGPAENLHIQCVVYKQTTPEDGETTYRGAYLDEGTVIGPQWLPLNRSGRDVLPDDFEPSEGPINSIQADEQSVWFNSEISLRPMAMGADPYSAPFREVMQRVRREWSDVDEIAIEFFLLYTDVINQPYAKWLETYNNVPLQKKLNLHKAMSLGEVGKRVGKPVDEEEVGAMLMIDPDEIDFSS